MKIQGKLAGYVPYVGLGLALVRVSPCLYDENGVCSILVVHGGTAVDPPLWRQQVLHVVLL